jgi:hypothetical protein
MRATRISVAIRKTRLFFVPFLPKIKANTNPDRARIMLALKGGDRVNF